MAESLTHNRPDRSPRMEWTRLINDKRFGMEGLDHRAHQGVRTDFQRDYDRLVFSSPFRRLQNKTQVFPLPGSIFVHNRLTHSLEVACVGRSMASQAVRILRERYASEPEVVDALESAGEIVAAACLAHDLGNPPFGHSGEKAIATFFSEGPGQVLRNEFTPGQWSDLTHFEGNANAFRLLTHQFVGRRPGGFAMTYSTLAAIVKYPFESSLATPAGKFGFFSSERENFSRVASELGMLRLSDSGPLRYARHPLVYLVEAADDICYEVMDIEDAHKLGLLPAEVVVPLFMSFFPEERQARMRETLQRVADPNEQISYLRSSVIGALVDACVDVFTSHEDEILEGRLHGPLTSMLPPLEGEAFKRAQALSWDKIYCAPDVVDIELAGTQIISFLLEKLIEAVRFPEMNYSRLLLAKVPGQYDVTHPTLFGKVQAVLDHISGMTDVYALDLYRKLNAMSLKINN